MLTVNRFFGIIWSRCSGSTEMPKAAVKMAYLDPELRDYLIQESSSLRAEMNEAVKETRALERWALTTGAVIWTWLATHPGPWEHWFIWLPFVVVSFFYFRTLALRSHINEIAEYLAKVEKQYPLPEHFGFERSFASSCRRKIKTGTAHAFWILLILLTLLAPFVATPNKALEGGPAVRRGLMSEALWARGRVPIRVEKEMAHSSG